MGGLLKVKGLRMSSQKQETLLKLTILSMAAVLCNYLLLFLELKNIRINKKWDNLFKNNFLFSF